MNHPAVQDVAVVGVPDATAGERPQAYVVRSSQSKHVAEEEIRRNINEHIEAAMTSIHWLGSRVVFIDEIPRNQSGKILKEDLKARARETL